MNNDSNHYFTLPYGKLETENYFVVKGIQLYLEGLNIKDISDLIYLNEEILIKRIKFILPFLDSIRLSLNRLEANDFITNVRCYKSGIKPKVIHSLMFNGVPMAYTEIRGVSRSWVEKELKKPRDIENYFHVKALQLYLEGMPMREISHILKISHDVIGQKIKEVKNYLEGIKLKRSKVEWLEILTDYDTIMLKGDKTKVSLNLINIPRGYQGVWGVKRVRDAPKIKRGRKKLDKKVQKIKVVKFAPYDSPNKNREWYRFWKKHDSPF